MIARRRRTHLALLASYLRAPLLLSALFLACAPRTHPPSTGATELSTVTGDPPPFLLGEFEDDYGGRPSISRFKWEQGTGTVYLPVAWHPAQQYLIARNASSNGTAPGAWTRIDWMPLTGMPPYSWAYCLSAFDAPSRDSAEATRIADRERPRTGCNGFPFSRLKGR